MISPDELMRLAIEKAREGIAAGQSPFGCAIARGDDVISIRHNTVIASIDITAHAEINALRTACSETGNVLLEDCVAATTCEPCPMCMSALHWARLETVYFGATIADAESAGFNELKLPAAEILSVGGSKVQLIGSILSDECKKLFDEWRQSPNPQTY